MFKRANKITALLVAAASVMSIVPAMAADSTRLGTKDGTIEDAIAYKDGKYAFEGYKTDDNNKSVYFNDGDKDKEINDLTDATINDKSKYDTSSTIAFDGNDEYLLDLSNGKVTDEDVASDLQSTAKDKLSAKLKKTDRYGADVTVDSFARITPDQFGDVWYEYSASKDGNSSVTGGTKAVISYTIKAADVTTLINTVNAAASGAVVNTKIANENVNLAATNPSVGYASGNKTSFKDLVESTSFGDYIASVDGTTGEVTLTQKVEANTNYATTGAGAIVNTNVFLNGDAKTNYSGGTVTLSQASTDKIGTTDGKPAIVKFQPTSFTSDVTINNVPVKVKSAGKAGATTAAGIAEAIKAHSFKEYDVTASATSAGDISVKLTQKSDKIANLNQVDLDLIASTNYSYSYTGTGASLNPVVSTVGVKGTFAAGTTGDSTFTGYTNKSGAYIDVDKTANIRVYNGSKMVKLDEFDEPVNNDGISATVKKSTTIAQDKDFIYRVIDVTFTAGTVYNSKGSAKITENKYLQKISKAQGETEKDAYLPKTVESYELNSVISGDAETAVNKIATLLSDADKVVGVRVVDGTMYYTEMDDADTIKTYKLKLQKNEKVEAAGSSSKVDAYVVKKDGDKDHDLKGDAGKDGAAFDVDGNLWIINEGKILKSEKAGDFKEMFTCDRSIDSLDVYDAGSLVAWDGNGNVYTTQQEGTKVTEGEAKVVAPVIVTGWVQDGANWSFNDATGAKVTNKWVNVGGVWYFLKADGVMATGWYNDNGTWYYLKSSGAMSTGWVNDGNAWYYCNASGAMLANTTVDGYVLNGSGAWVK